MIKNIIIAVLALMLISVTVFALQQASVVKQANIKTTERTKEAEEIQKKAERLTEIAEQQAAAATRAMAEAQLSKEQLKKCVEGK
ncbi:MAG: hypothetical protein AAFQ94_15735 [Bacteroidota bacterium]